MSDQQGKARTSVAGNAWSTGSTGDGEPELYRSDSGAARLPDPPEAESTRVQPAASEAPAKPAQPARPAVVSAGPRSVSRRTRKARLRLSRIDPWSVMKTSFLFSIAFGIMFWFATYVVWSVIGASGLFDAVNSILQSLLSNPNDQTQIRIEDFVNTNKVLGVAALIAVINVVLLTAIGTLTAFLYNLSANILGGLELTLAED
ncbi:DUF3566 domain-containing protein [Micropruina sonneratiae]|uniref:DUF3566 domain-containing protein n=1 Tax=Micropruina sonneratiae TaxID=2986940 RepID=UPI0022280782|nr:DUF3566 domain-containing protein [Micropruina sp. KQZ13P-5]MCW3159450.1 DUF3566 domain-containing protein [Micropruina sp. KQZ13P-5]